MREIIRQIYDLLSPTERLEAYGCFVAMVFMAIFEVIGIASILPFIAVIADPEALQHHAKLAWLYNQLHFQHLHHFLIFLGCSVFGILILSNVITMVATWKILNFSCMRDYTLSTKLLSRYLHQPYVFFTTRHSAELANNIISEIGRVINQAFIPLMQIAAKSIAVLFILALLLSADPILGLTILIVLGGAYSAVYLLTRRQLIAISKRCVKNIQQKHKIVSESLGGIKEIKLLGKEDRFLAAFSDYTKQYAGDRALSEVMATLPRYALEIIAFGGVLLIIIYFLFMERNLTDVTPLLALYAFASIRLMPALQQIFSAITYIRLGKEPLQLIHQDLNQQSVLPSHHPLLPLSFNRKLELRNISYRYPNAAKEVLAGVNLTISAKSTVGFVGLTGAGKTTIIDIILGLLSPQQGALLVDDIELNQHTIASWQRKIGYVPQSIYLTDDTVAHNIALGVQDDKIDLQRIESAARIANIHHFISNDLQDGYQTVVGDRGIRLSGGQKQRIGIARALYHDPDVLVLDEATSSLDMITENAILDAIHQLSRQKTIIIIAHRLTTLTECDVIHVLHEGEILSSGTYPQLIESCSHFSKMAMLHS